MLYFGRVCGNFLRHFWLESSAWFYLLQIDAHDKSVESE